MDEHEVSTHGVSHGRDTFGWELFDLVAVLVLVAAALGYALGLWVSRHRSPWPARRTACWYVGVGCAGAGLVGPVATAGHSSFTAHMAGHLLTGMVAPLLLVLGAPLSMALRSLPVDRARLLTRVLRTGPLPLLTHPVVAGALNGGGLWILYATDLYRLMHTSALLYAAVHVHVVLAGYLFTTSVVGVDPAPHRSSIHLRSAVLILFIAAHATLAKWVYAHPPAGVATADAQTGAQLMYFGGDVVDITLIVLLLAGWYTATAPRGPAIGGTRMNEHTAY